VLNEVVRVHFHPADERGEPIREKKAGATFQMNLHITTSAAAVGPERRKQTARLSSVQAKACRLADLMITETIRI